MKKPVEKISKAQLLKEIDEKLSALNLLRSALAVDPDRTQANFEKYRKTLTDTLKGKG
jgi:two-component sensor histidine kinase